MPNEGDALRSLTVSFGGPVRISELKLVNGYPKRDPCRQELDRFYQYARPILLEVDLNNGSAPRQLPVVDTRDAQTLSISGTTEQLTLRVLRSEPADASRLSAAQDAFAVPAISELSFLGSTGG
jgi:hypothetical protein